MSGNGVGVPTIVYDTALPQFLNNQVFAPEYNIHFPGAFYLVELRQKAMEQGWQMMTGDQILVVLLRKINLCQVCFVCHFSKYRLVSSRFTL